MSLALVPCAAAGRAGAQASAVPADTVGPSVACRGEVVSRVDIVAHPPFHASRFRNADLLRRAERSLHVTTKPEVIRNFLLLREGIRCTELRRQESERILRAQPFLSAATVTAYPESGGAVRVVVATVDEVSTVVGARVGKGYLELARMGDANLMGRGIFAAGEWSEGRFYRDQFGARLVDYQVFDRPYQLRLSAIRRKLGGDLEAGLARPFLTDLQRSAWRVSAGATRDFAPFSRPGLPMVSLGVSRTYRDAGGIVRVGRPGRLALVGASLSRESDAPEGMAVIVGDSALRPDTAATSVIGGRYPRHHAARGNLLLGVRTLRFLPVSGFDALTATQDLRLGTQLGVLLGRSVAMLGPGDDDLLVATDLYSGAGGRRSFAGVQLHGEVRRDFATGRWDGLVTSGRGAWYRQRSPDRLLITSAEFGAGWRVRVPYQLLLGTDDGGVRGYAGAHAAGARRMVLRAEDRRLVGQLSGVADIGTAAFVDVGRVEAGDAPFGVTTPPRVGLGVALLAAVPAGAKRTWRLDVAVPVSHEAGAGWELRLTSIDATRLFWREPADVRRSREFVAPGGIFNWP